MEDGEAEGGARPGGIRDPDTFEADEAGQGAGGGGGEEGLDLREIGSSGGRLAGEIKVRPEDGVGEVLVAKGVGSVAMVGIRV